MIANKYYTLPSKVEGKKYIQEINTFLFSNDLNWSTVTVKHLIILQKYFYFK